MGSWGQEKVPTTLQGFATWRRQVSGLEAATRHDVIRHGITLDMAARSWSSNYHRNIIEHWHWNHWSPEIFPFLAAASEEWFGMMLTGTQQDLKYFEIEWGSMMLHVGTHFFPDFDCRLQIVFFLGLPRLRQCVFGMLDFCCHFSAFLSISQHFQFGHRNASRPTGSIQSCSLWESQCHSEEKINRDWQNDMIRPVGTMTKMTKLVSIR